MAAAFGRRQRQTGEGKGWPPRAPSQARTPAATLLQEPSPRTRRSALRLKFTASGNPGTLALQPTSPACPLATSRLCSRAGQPAHGSGKGQLFWEVCAVGAGPGGEGGAWRLVTAI